MQDDTELNAMQQVVGALDGLDEDVRARVLEWAGKRYRVVTKGGSGDEGDIGDGDGEDDGATEEGAFAKFVDLIDAANPTTEDERALVGGYWFQIVHGRENFTGGDVNNTLKETGKGVTNITRCYDSLEKRRPAEVRQMAKSGKSKQGRKKYKLTTEGARRVERMIRAESGGGDDE